MNADSQFGSLSSGVVLAVLSLGGDALPPGCLDAPHHPPTPLRFAVVPRDQRGRLSHDGERSRQGTVKRSMALLTRQTAVVEFVRIAFAASTTRERRLQGRDDTPSLCAATSADTLGCVRGLSGSVRRAAGARLGAR